MTSLNEPVAELPWASRPDHHCFGCSAANPRGLALEFRHSDDQLSTEVLLDHHYESYPGVTHGGILGLICDETIGNLIVIERETPAVTTSMRMRYVGVARIGSRYRCVARIGSTTNGLISGSAEILDEAGALIATATATYQPQESLL